MLPSLIFLNIEWGKINENITHFCPTRVFQYLRRFFFLSVKTRFDLIKLFMNNFTHFFVSYILLKLREKIFPSTETV